ncbi:MAG: uracil-DNA glycosylase [Candidatus Odinarchaeota archaeon]
MDERIPTRKLFSRQFVMKLSDIQSSNLFNPYSDRCILHDKPDGPVIRRNNLEKYLAHLADNKPPTIWVGEALGYLGGRRTGLPFTDERHLACFSEVFQTEQMEKATETGPLPEKTAGTIWKLLKLMKNPPFLWNIVPFHPHESGNPLSNRSPSRNDVELTADLTSELIDFFDFDRIYAIGRKAEHFLSKAGYNCLYVRHPSHGGSKKFTRIILHDYDL